MQESLLWREGHFEVRFLITGLSGVFFAYFNLFKPFMFVFYLKNKMDVNLSGKKSFITFI